MITNITILFFFFLGITFIHELAHIITGRAFGIKMSWVKFHCVNFDPTGFSKITRWKKATVIIIGPTMTFLTACLLFVLGVKDYALIAFILFLFNVIPFQNSDIRNLRYYLRR